jgi:chromosome segregation ATPase
MPEKREVTNKDLEIIDKAIADHEVFQKDLFVLRRILGEIGKLDTAIAQTRRGLQTTEKSRDELNAQVEVARAELATVQKQQQGVRNEIATLDSQIKAKQIEFNQLCDAVDRIKQNLTEAA